MNSNNEFEKETNSLTEDEKEFNLVYGKLNTDNKNEIKDFADWLAEKQKME